MINEAFAVFLGLTVTDHHLVPVPEAQALGEERGHVIMVVRNFTRAQTTNDADGLQTNDVVIENLPDPRTESAPRGCYLALICHHYMS